MTLELTFVGIDSWKREVFQDQKKRYYKRYKDDFVFYASSTFNGEPSLPVGSHVNIVIKEDHS